jgi:hypothetical protein
MTLWKINRFCRGGFLTSLLLASVNFFLKDIEKLDDAGLWMNYVTK